MFPDLCVFGVVPECLRHAWLRLTVARLLSRKSIELITDNAIGDLDLRNYSEQGLTLKQNLRCYCFGLGVRVRESGESGASGWLGSPGDLQLGALPTAPISGLTLKNS